MTTHASRRDLLKLGAGAVAGGLAAATPAVARAEQDDRARWPNLKITKVTSFLLECELERAFGASVSVPLAKTRDALLVKIETDAGLVGWGETSPISGARSTIDKFLAPRLIGQNPLEYRRLWRSLWGPNFGNGLATGAVEMAINDLRGKALGMPIHKLLGGKLRDKIRMYASSMRRDLTPLEEAKRAVSLVEEGVAGAERALVKACRSFIDEADFVPPCWPLRKLF